jgi:hypothetical protein
MKTVISFLLALMLAASIADAQSIESPPLKQTIPFISGEKLTYQMRYGFLVGGTTTLLLTEEVYLRKTVFHAQAIGQSTGIANTVYSVRDIYDSWFDMKTTLPYKQVRNINEGHYKNYNEVTYNRRNNTVHSSLSGEHKVPEKILDLCSVFYYIRRVDFSKMKEDDVVSVNMFFADEIFPFHLRYLGKETIKTKLGKINCIKISPVVEPGRMFKTKDDMTIWFSDDENCLPVLVRMDIRIIGAVVLKLIKHENIADTLVIQTKKL